MEAASVGGDFRHASASFTLLLERKRKMQTQARMENGEFNSTLRHPFAACPPLSQAHSLYYSTVARLSWAQSHSYRHQTVQPPLPSVRWFSLDFQPSRSQRSRKELIASPRAPLSHSLSVRVRLTEKERERPFTPILDSIHIVLPRILRFALCPTIITITFYLSHQSSQLISTFKMSDFKSKALFDQITEGLKTMDDKEKKDIQKKVRFQNTEHACRSSRCRYRTL